MRSPPTHSAKTKAPTEKRFHRMRVSDYGVGKWQVAKPRLGVFM